jgi:ribosomal protein S18 acetylase RimI-like enzyme
MLNSPQPAEAEMLVALTEATGFFNAEEIKIVREMLDAYFENPANDEYHWLVFRETPDAPPCGYVCYGPASLAAGTYDLYWIAVDRAYQDKKIGSALLQGMEHDLARRGARQIYIETSDKPQYAPTRAFYERRGYILVAHFRDYYAVGDGKVIYFKALDINKI